MDINVFNNNFEKIAIVDQYRSLMWSKRFYDVGALDLEIEASNETLAIFKKGYYITRDDDDAIYVIKALEIDTQEDNDNFLIVGAFECKSILNQRIIWKQVNFTGTAENYIRKLITDNVINPEIAARKINNFNLKAAKGFTEQVEQQVTYDNLCDKIIEICTTFGYGWKITRENGQFYFDLYKGVDHSIDQDVNPRVVFSPDNENIISTKYLTDDSEFKNVALVGGEGEGVDRKLRTIGSAEGLERYEMFVDASGISSNTEEGDLVDYYNALISEGKEKLSEQAVTTSFEGEVDTNSYLYKTDYNLGDIVTLKNEYGIMANARITEVIETWDDEGYTVEPKFEYFEPIEYEEAIDGALLTENSLMMLTESAAPLLTESSQSVEGVKISQLDPVDELFDGCCFPIVQNGVTKKVTKATLQEEIAEGIEVPTKTSDLENDSDFVTSDDVPTKTSDLENDSDFKPVIKLTQAQYDALTEAEKMADVIYMIEDETETIADILIDDENVADNKTYSSEKVEEIASIKADVSSVPTKTSQLTNDSGFWNGAKSIVNRAGSSSSSYVKIFTTSATDIFQILTTDQYGGTLLITGQPYVDVEVSGTYRGIKVKRLSTGNWNSDNASGNNKQERVYLDNGGNIYIAIGAYTIVNVINLSIGNITVSNVTSLPSANRQITIQE